VEIDKLNYEFEWFTTQIKKLDNIQLKVNILEIEKFLEW
jgi:hypothetical protein